MKILYKLKKMFGLTFEQKQIRKGQTCFIYCNCGNELISSNSFVEDIIDKNGNNHVKYICRECNKFHDYNFDIAPIPISWEELNKKS